MLVRLLAGAGGRMCWWRKLNAMSSYCGSWLMCLALLAPLFTNGLIDAHVVEKEKQVKPVDVEGVEGMQVSLPCPLAASTSDKVYMVLWFRDGVGIPLYSLDVRGVSLSKGIHWSSPDIFGPRARFNIDADVPALEIEDVKRHDQGVYRCRVDFRTSQTQSFRYNLSIIILPERPIILDRFGVQLNGTTIGPVEEGDDMTLVCRVVGGRPQPAVRWLINGDVVDDQYEHNFGDVIENRLMRPPLYRENLGAIFTCQAVNTLIVKPKESSYVLDMLLKPLNAKIISPPTPLVADRRYEVPCESVGSRPNAIITWYKGKRPLRRTKDEVIDVNTTRSEMSFVPTIEDDGKTITCRAENPKVTGQFVEIPWKLNVVYPPIVTLRLGSTLSAEDIKDGEDVYFECHVQANPQWRKLYWLHDGVVLPHNTTARVIRSNQSLVLQKVTRNSSGNYSCSAVNSEGETVSNHLQLRVQYAPICVTDKVIIVGAFRNENLNIVCEVFADPPPKSFRWKFNNSGENLDIDKDRHHKNGSMMDVLRYTPVTDQDFGTLSCWGVNEVGMQQNPCLFQVVLAGLPGAVKNCSVSNQTSHAVEIQCLAGFDGGLPQVFVLELVSARSGKLRFNMTNSEEPVFVIESIENYLTYDHSFDDYALKVVVFAVNQKGRSPGVVLKEFLFDSNIENHAAAPESSSATLSPIILGCLLTLMILCCVLVSKMYSRKRANSNDTLNGSKQSNVLLCKQDMSKKNDKTSPRWQHSDMYVKEAHKESVGNPNAFGDPHHAGSGAGSNQIMEDERDPDVIPAQFVPNDLDSTASHNEWTDPYLLEKFAIHETRPNNLLLKPLSGTLPMPGHHHHNHQLATTTGTTTMSTGTTGRGVRMMTTTTSGSALNLQHLPQPAVTTKTGLSPYFHTGTYHPTTTSAGGRDSATTTTNLLVQNGGGSSGDLDINVNVIKNMLLANRVPESCV